jgi:Mrp family chromosome partitioning ATPase
VVGQPANSRGFAAFEAVVCLVASFLGYLAFSLLSHAPGEAIGRLQVRDAAQVSARPARLGALDALRVAMFDAASTTSIQVVRDGDLEFKVTCLDDHRDRALANCKAAVRRAVTLAPRLLAPDPARERDVLIRSRLHDLVALAAANPALSAANGSPSLTTPVLARWSEAVRLAVEAVMASSARSTELAVVTVTASPELRAEPRLRNLKVLGTGTAWSLLVGLVIGLTGRRISGRDRPRAVVDRVLDESPVPAAPAPAERRTSSAPPARASASAPPERRTSSAPPDKRTSSAPPAKGTSSAPPDKRTSSSPPGKPSSSVPAARPGSPRPPASPLAPGVAGTLLSVGAQGAAAASPAVRTATHEDPQVEVQRVQTILPPPEPSVPPPDSNVLAPPPLQDIGELPSQRPSSSSPPGERPESKPPRSTAKLSLPSRRTTQMLGSLTGSASPVSGPPQTPLPPGATTIMQSSPPSTGRYSFVSTPPPPGGAQVIPHDAAPNWAPDPRLDAVPCRPLSRELFAFGVEHCFTLGVCCVPGLDEERTELAGSLALALTATGHARVLLIDANFDQPLQHKVMRAEMPPGKEFARQIQEHMMAQGSDQWSVLRCTKNLHLLLGGPSPTPGMILTRSFELCVRGMRTYYDFIVLDGPSGNRETECQAFDGVVDGLVIACTEDLRGEIAKTSRHFTPKRFSRAIRVGASRTQ